MARITDKQLQEFLAEYTRKNKKRKYDTQQHVKASLLAKFFHSGANINQLIMRMEELGFFEIHNDTIIFSRQWYG